ncbi:aminoglycoside phosphotransferase family protein [Halomonas vilamensis]|uniref:Aminoglycoside phosphotransferase family protein n=1 Tax=Vreelandella vilamensis TaxID=531309 RepID=A0ABU1H075_9GAMM|nr:aminoglycoside phosphotransferase family protein [Halomonas vilamensis]MDR5897720.1 aminoglycoside phosphotransferase family protein [Halomonas vilamensis]
MPTPGEQRLTTLETELRRANITYRELSSMADTGLAHDHVWLHRNGDDWVARLPKQSQMNLAPADNLAYEAACYERASLGGHVPRLHGLLPVSDALPRGGLLVDAIEGRLAQLPEDLPRIAETLASLHRLALPDQPAPLFAPSDPWQAMREEVSDQAQWLEKAELNAEVVARIRAELDALPTTLPDAERCLISFDTHPGNFLITEDGRAVLVDLEKCRYGLPGIDLAHTSLYTSTTWDVNSQAVLTLDDVVAFYQRWQAAMGKSPSAETLVACRRATWLWSLTWCAKWRAQHLHAKDAERRGEDWSAELTDAAVIAHVRDRVEHYLSPPIIEHVQNELQRLKNAL